MPALQQQPQAALPLLGVAALQLETRPVPTADNLAHADALLDRECRRLGVRRWDGGEGSAAGGGGGAHLDILILPETFNSAYLLSEAAWFSAEGLADPARSPSLAALSRWAARYRCFLAATLLEATPDGHIYNSLVLAAPDGSFVRPAGSGAGSSEAGSSRRVGLDSTGGAGASLALVRKARASSLEGFVFRSGGAPGRGGEPAAHVVDIDAAPLLAKRGGDVGAAASQGRPLKLRLAFSICYENMCLEPMSTILEEHRRRPISLLISPFCAMEPDNEHPTFKWPKAAAERLSAAMQGVSRMHAAKLGVHTVACHHTGDWASPLPRLLPFLPRDAVPLSGPFLGCSAICAPGGTALQQLGREQEGLILVHLPLLQQPPASPQAGERLAGSALAGVVGEAAAASTVAGTSAPLARYAGGYCIQPPSWQVKYGFSLMEALGSFSYHVWRAPLRRRMARAIAAEGVWRGQMPALEGPGSGIGWGSVAAVAALAAAGTGAAVALWRRG